MTVRTVQITFDCGDPAAPALESEAARLVATTVHRHDPTPPIDPGHIVMADPEGNEFCLD